MYPREERDILPPDGQIPGPVYQSGRCNSPLTPGLPICLDTISQSSELDAITTQEMCIPGWSPLASARTGVAPSTLSYLEYQSRIAWSVSKEESIRRSNNIHHLPREDLCLMPWFPRQDGCSQGMRRSVSCCNSLSPLPEDRIAVAIRHECGGSNPSSPSVSEAWYISYTSYL
jgi:hypothetical protein